MFFNLLFKEVVFWMIWGWVLWHPNLELPNATKLSTLDLRVLSSSLRSFLAQNERSQQPQEWAGLPSKSNF